MKIQNYLNNYFVIDLETDGTKKRDRFCDPLEKDHKIIMIQVKTKGKDPIYKYEHTGIDRKTALKKIPLEAIIVGQNIKFDLLYLWECPAIQEFFKNGGLLWDTNTVDYLLNGQNKLISYSLDDLAVKYGGTLKPNNIKDLYLQGLKTSEIIDRQGLETYLEYSLGDVLNTELVYLKQIEQLSKTPELFILIQHYMKHYIALIELEYNGIYVNKNEFELLRDSYTEQVKVLTEQVKKVFTSQFPSDVLYNIDSVDDVSLVLYGGYKPTIKKILLTDPSGMPIVYSSKAQKAGEPKYKNIKYVYEIKGLGLDKSKAKPVKKVGFYSTDDDSLSVFNHTFIPVLTEYRTKSKILEHINNKVYEHLNPYTGCIHSEFNTTITTTGRLSSRNPNLQNISPNILSTFSSRFGDDGIIIELDWQQLEVCVAAFIFNDGILQAELLSGIDIHLENAKMLFNKQEISKEERKTAKFMTFEILYKCSARSLAKKHSISLPLAEAFIQNFYNKYTDIHLAHINLQNETRTNSYRFNEEYSIANLVTIHGKKYSPHDYESDRGGRYFNQSQIANIKIQGTASDIVNIGIGAISTILLNNRDKFLLVNEVHDSMIFDCKKSCCNYVQTTLKSIIEGAVKEFTKTELFKLDVKTGKNWLECKS